jgi:hypothetical protein
MVRNANRLSKPPAKYVFVLMVCSTNSSREKNIGSDGMQCKQLSRDCFNLGQNIDFDVMYRQFGETDKNKQLS